MDAQDACGLCFGPSTRPRKANEKIYVLVKYGPKGAHPRRGRAPGVAELRWLPPGPSFLVAVPSMPRRAVRGCICMLNAGRMVWGIQGRNIPWNIPSSSTYKRSPSSPLKTHHYTPQDTQHKSEERESTSTPWA
jgi:hypothetical protein